MATIYRLSFHHKPCSDLTQKNEKYSFINLVYHWLPYVVKERKWCLGFAPGGIITIAKAGFSPGKISGFGKKKTLNSYSLPPTSGYLVIFAPKQMTLHIIGGGGLSREVQSLLPALQYTHWQVYDDDPSLHYPSPQTIPERSAVAVAMGDSRQRSTAVARLLQPLHFPNLLHPRALLQNAQSIHFEHGTIITAGCILTCHITMGAFCFLNLNCTVGHDVVLGNYVSLMPAVNLGGNVTCEDEVYLGTGANILPGVHIGRRAIVGSGAVVTKNVPPNTTVVGVPAQAL